MDERLTKDEKKAQRREEWQEKLDREKRNSLLQKIALWGGIALFVVLGIFSLVAFSQNNSGNYTTSNSITMPKITSSDFSLGPKNAKAVLVEYADFQCPACGAYYPLLKQLTAEEKNKLLFVYRFFPLKNVHQNALNSVKAVYAASVQGKFWEMHDLLFENQSIWGTLPDPEDTFVDYAKKLGLNTDQFKKDYASQKASDLGENGYSDSVSLGLNSTPSFFLNGKFVTQNPQSYVALKKMIEDAAK